MRGSGLPDGPVPAVLDSSWLASGEGFSDTAPRCLKISAHPRQRISDRPWPEGTRLPTLRQLRDDDDDVGASTIRAVPGARGRGVVDTPRGLGSYVASVPPAEDSVSHAVEQLPWCAAPRLVRWRSSRVGPPAAPCRAARGHAAAPLEDHPTVTRSTPAARGPLAPVLHTAGCHSGDRARAPGPSPVPRAQARTRTGAQ